MLTWQQNCILHIHITDITSIILNQSHFIAIFFLLCFIFFFFLANTFDLEFCTKRALKTDFNLIFMGDLANITLLLLFAEPVPWTVCGTHVLQYKVSVFDAKDWMKIA